MRPYAWITLVIVVLLIGGGVYAYLHYVPKAAAPGGAGAPSGPVTFYCGGGNSFQATFSDQSVMLMFPDGRMLTLPQTISGSGIRYEATTTGSDVVFSSKGDSGMVSDSALPNDATYASCTAADVSAETGDRLVYTDRSNTFSFQFPAEFSVAGIDVGYSPSWSALATTSGLQLAKITVPASFEPGTNFGDATFTVGTSADPSAVASCLTNPAPTPSASSTPATLDGVPFTKLSFSDAAAGNRYDTTSYRTVKDGQCYAVEYTIHYGVLENYPKGSVQAFDETKVANALDNIAQGFRFLQ